jgi:hypothetical protein
MKAALEQLGFDPCYHMGEVVVPNPGVNEGHLDAWHDFYVEGKDMDWGGLLQNYKACVDFPTCLYYQELMEVFPDAVVVLNTRDPEKWFESWEHLMSICDAVNDPDRIVRFEKWLPCVYAIRERYFGGQIEQLSNIKVFNDHLDSVRRNVPSNRLLEFRVTEGWGPLCEFLSVDNPDAPFPHLNEREGMLELLQMVLWTNESFAY